MTPKSSKKKTLSMAKEVLVKHWKTFPEFFDTVSYQLFTSSANM